MKIKSRTKKIVAVGAVVALATLGVAACSSDADVASYNLSKAADNFEVPRRIVFVNGITDKYLLVIEGLCSLGNDDPPGKLSVTCKDGNEYRKHFLGLSDNVTFVVEQLVGVKVSDARYRVVFKPEQIIPDIRPGG